MASAPSLLNKAWFFRPSRTDIQRERQTGSPRASTIWQQPLDPDGSNIITYLLERWTDQDPNWTIAQEWLKRIDPELAILKSPLRSNMASLETTNKFSRVDVNLAYQGTGLQRALAIIAAVIFSPKGSTIIIEEPEVHLHRGSIEALVDLFNHAVNDLGKQIILSTRSIDLLLQYASDVGIGSPRGHNHNRIDPSRFKLLGFERNEGKISVRDYLMQQRFSSLMDQLRELLKPQLSAGPYPPRNKGTRLDLGKTRVQQCKKHNRSSTTTRVEIPDHHPAKTPQVTQTEESGSLLRRYTNTDGTKTIHNTQRLQLTPNYN